MSEYLSRCQETRLALAAADRLKFLHCANCEEFINECFRLRACGAFSVRTDIYRAASTSSPFPSFGPNDVMRQAVTFKQACSLG